MVAAIFSKVFGSANDRYLKAINPLVGQINGLEAQMQALSDTELQAKTWEFKQRAANGEPLDAMLPEAFAVVREAGIRVLGMRHYDTQLVGGIILHRGRIAEMKTGEGKTLVATLPMYLNACAGKGAHLVTVNDYLARRDSEWMGRIYKFLGLSVGLIVHGLSNRKRREAYRSDITYGQNNEFGFDYLRDNMKFALEDMVQREKFFAIVDEVDSILIDEARTPLIISGNSEDNTALYLKVNGVVKDLADLARDKGKQIAQEKFDEEGEFEEVEGLAQLAASIKGRKRKDLAGDYYYFIIDEKGKSVILSDAGIEYLQDEFGVDNLYEPAHIELLHAINQSLKAHMLYQADVEYVLQDGKVVIVDEFTGRMMPGRRWSDGMHQSIEAKEGVPVQNESQTLASITFQNYFRMYDKLSGMTGTAATEAQEFSQIYGMNVSVIPTNKPMVRQDHRDVVFKTKKEKYDAVTDEIIDRHKKGQPILVGTVSVESSEYLSKQLNRKGVKHNVLNAKLHDKEAAIVAQAGRKGAVTIATNMAGRGTDIVLGGNPEEIAWDQVGRDAELEVYQGVFDEAAERCKGEKEYVLNNPHGEEYQGLAIIGTERHDSRRIDNQLRGRSGRQGDPGTSRFYLSLEDDLMRVFGGDRIRALMDRFGVEEGQVIQSKMVDRAIANAQQRVEGHNFDIRKHLLEYDDVMNEQRKTIFAKRQEVLQGEGEEQRERVLDMIEEAIIHITESFGKPARGETFDITPLQDNWLKTFAFPFPEDVAENLPPLEELQEKLYLAAEQVYQAKIDKLQSIVGDEAALPQWQRLEREIHMQILDKLWRRHLLAMDHLREGISLRSYGARNPKNEYKKEGFAIFSELLGQISLDTVETIFRVEVRTQEEIDEIEEANRQAQEKRKMEYSSGERQANKKPQKVETQKRGAEKIGPNDPCPCGSGKKFKKCHWRDPSYASYR